MSPLASLLTVPAIVLAAGVARADLAALSWMSGCWSPDGHEAGSFEQWSLPGGGSMLGTNRTVSNGKTVFFEFLRIVEQDDGAIVLIASPSGQETAQFRMTGQGAREVVFENPDHDYPQRIAYRLGDDGKLLGRIEGEVDGETRVADFPMTRIACDGAPGSR